MGKDLFKMLASKTLKENWDAIVVEGYDGVGKGHILDELSESLGVIPYRPDYNLWQMHDLRKTDRWKISGFFWDIFSHFNNKSGDIMLFDRGVISGAVYDDDILIAKDYKKLLRGMRVLHILVVCSKEDYLKMLKVRHPHFDEIDFDYEWDKYLEYENRYKLYLEAAGVEYIVYQNEFNESLASVNEQTCAGCGHYNYGVCRHPKINREVSPNLRRCELSYEVEVQDRDVNEMCCM